MSNYSTIQKDQLKKLGSYLKETREEQGKSIEEISLQTYIRPQLIMRIESGDAADLPQPIFVQGFIRRYADALGLDGMKLSRQFPVHSIPDTPRPTPRPAIPTSPLGKTPTRPPAAIPPKPAESLPSAKLADPWADSAAAEGSVETPGAGQGVKDTVLTGDLPDPSSPPKPATNGVVGGASVPMAVPSPNTRPSSQSPSIPVSSGWGSNVPSSQYNQSSNKTPYILAGVLAALVVGAIALLTNVGGNRPQQAEQTDPAPAPEEVAETIPVVPEPEPEPEPEPANPTANSTAPVAVSVSLTDASWMRIAIDGNVVFADTMEAGVEELYEAQESIYIRAGNAGAVTLSHNGSTPKVAGAPGAIEDLYFTPETPSSEAAE